MKWEIFQRLGGRGGGIGCGCESLYVPSTWVGGIVVKPVLLTSYNFCMMKSFDSKDVDQLRCILYINKMQSSFVDVQQLSLLVK